MANSRWRPFARTRSFGAVRDPTAKRIPDTGVMNGVPELLNFPDESKRRMAAK